MTFATLAFPLIAVYESVHLNFELSMPFLSNLASLVEFLNDKKSSLLRIVKTNEYGSRRR